MNILLHTWVISKKRGSEFSVTYNHIIEMSREHYLYILVDSCSYTLADHSEFIDYNISNCEFIFVPPTIMMKLTRVFGKIPGYFNGWFKYFYYRYWEQAAFRYVKKYLIDKIDLIHYLGPAGYHEPGYLWKLEKPYIWGPTSGFENVKDCLRKYYLKYRYITFFKSLLNIAATKMNYRVRNAICSAQTVIAATSGNKDIIQNEYKVRNIVYFPENIMRINDCDILPVSTIHQKFACLKNEPINIIWCASLVARKMPNLLMDILFTVQNKQRFSINIVGGGEFLPYVKKKAEQLKCLGMDITVYGRLPREEVQSFFKRAHIHLLTSAYEANSTVMFEAMENCVPSVALNICGMADIIKENTGVKINVYSYLQCMHEMADVLDNFAVHPELLLEKSLSLREDSFNYIVTKREDFYNRIYHLD